MYWFWTNPFPSTLIWLLMMGLVTLGGWAIASVHFELERHERVLVGFGLGLAMFLWAANWLGRWLSPYSTFILAGLVVFLLGLASLLKRPGPHLDIGDWNIPVWLLAGLALGWMFLKVSIGTGMFDEYKNVALISTLANGGIPAVAYFGGSQLLLYHYGFHLFGASMMQIGHLMPWSAWDLSKAIAWAISVLLAGLVGKRFLRSAFGAAAAGSVMTLAGGTRYLLLLLPSGFLQSMDPVIRVFSSNTDTANTLSKALVSTWVVDSGPPIGYPFAFLSGIFPPYTIAHGGEPTISLLLFMLVLLLVARGRNWASVVTYAVLFSFWGLASETDYGLFAIAWAVGFGIWLIRFPLFRFKRPEIDRVTVGLLASAPFVLIQGGVFTAIAQKFVSADLLHVAAASAGAASNVSASGFSLQWPPAIVSAHFGVLPVTNPLALFIAILEMGPAVLFLPWLTYDWWKSSKKDNWLSTLLVLISWSGLLIILFFQYSSQRDIVHVTGSAVRAVVLLLLYRLDQLWAESANARRPSIFWAGAGAIGLMCVSGLVLGGVQLSATQQVMLTDHYGDREATLLKEVWGRLPKDSKILGPTSEANILTGQLTGGILNPPGGNQGLVWNELMKSPTLSQLIQQGFDFVFVDSAWWLRLSNASKRQLEDKCISVFAESGDDTSPFFLKILDLRGCH